MSEVDDGLVCDGCAWAEALVSVVALDADGLAAGCSSSAGPALPKREGAGPAVGASLVIFNSAGIRVTNRYGFGM